MILALFLLLAGAGAWSQNELPSSGLPQNLRSTGFRPAQEQRQELRTAQNSLPDAPSAVPAKQRREISGVCGGKISVNLRRSRNQCQYDTRIAGVPRAQSNAQRLALCMERPWFKRNRTSFQIIIRVTAFWVVLATLLPVSLSHATIPGRKGLTRRICSGRSRQRLLLTQLTVGIGRNSFRIRHNPSRGLSAISGLLSAATREKESFGSSGPRFTKYSGVIR